MPVLTTDRLRLVPITLGVVEAVLDRDRIAAESQAGFEFPDNWPNDELVARAFPYSRDALRANPEVRLWGDSLVVLKHRPLIVGSVVFHGLPSDGIAEVAYGIEEQSRGQGFATEATRACVEWALGEPGIVAVQATTFSWHKASLG